MPYLVELSYRTVDNKLKVTQHTENFDFQTHENFREYETKSFSNFKEELSKILPNGQSYFEGSCGTAKPLEQTSGTVHKIAIFKPEHDIKAPPIAPPPSTAS